MKKLSKFVRGTQPSELVHTMKKHLARLTGAEPLSKEEQEKSMTRIAECLGNMKLMLYGDVDQDAKDDHRKKLTALMLEEDEDGYNMLYLLISNLQLFDFEGKKDAAAIVNFVVKQNDAEGYIIKHLDTFMKILLDGYDENNETPSAALPSGSILQEMVKKKNICAKMLESDLQFMYKVMAFVDMRNFDVASDAFTTLKLLTTRHKQLLATYLLENYDVFFQSYNALISSKNYVTRRQSLRLLGEILLERANFKVMMKYIVSKDNLKLLMTMLKDKSKQIQFEAFHVFKVFVANPKKNYEIKLVLWNNKTKLIEYMKIFRGDLEDQQFIDEKQLVIQHLESLKKPTKEEEKTE